MGNVVSAGEIRRSVVDLCNQGQFFAAHMRLIDNGLDAHTHPSLWELIERRAAEAGDEALAHRVRREILAADVASVDTVLNEARYEIEQGQLGRARALLARTFGEEPENSEARILLGIALAPEDRAAAIHLLDDAQNGSEVETLWAVDAFRDLGELKRAMRLCQTAINRFPMNAMFRNRLGWIAEGVGDFETAIAAATMNLNGDPDTKVRALNRLVRLHRRLGDKPKAMVYAAQLLREAGSPVQKLALARTLGQTDLLYGIVGSLPSLHARGGLAEGEARKVLTFLLDEGEIGLVLFLWREGVPIEADMRRVLMRKGFGEARADLPRSIEDAMGIRSPEVLFPLLPEASDLPLPSDWSPPLRDTDKIMLVNSVLAAGGAERQFLMLARALVAGGIDPDRLHAALFSLERDRGHGHFEDALRATGIHVHDLSAQDLSSVVMRDHQQDTMALLPGRMRSDVVALYGLAQQLKPAVIHGWQDRAGVASGLVSQLLGIRRTVISARNMRPRKRGDEADWIAHSVYKDLVAMPSVAITANATEGARDYEDWLDLPRGEISILSNAVDETVFFPTPNPPPSDGPIRILGVFRLAENKRPLLWVDTMAALRNRHGLDIAPRIVGAGPLAGELQRRADQLGLHDLRLDPPVEDPSAIYRDADVLVLLSQVEGTPNVVLEAQACGLPVAACRVGGVAEALHRDGPGGGLLLEAEIDASAAADAIAQWLPTALAADYRPRVQFILDRYSNAALVDRLLDLYGATP
ncbi:glycosyltransferase [Jannaschia sp. CCS1]|uniref:glycosyltransferase n=1 Tax=Jannaschia sp. (strain CCS1) TaxID=290400 RepID=UPI000053B8B1|nr:glycosyltransferase [Jannaschia sp. CCS1]ABD56577.1 glycosyl transferase group 1 [Jannaschia sp. CCS1]